MNIHDAIVGVKGHLFGEWIEDIKRGTSKATPIQYMSNKQRVKKKTEIKIYGYSMNSVICLISNKSVVQLTEIDAMKDTQGYRRLYLSKR